MEKLKTILNKLEQLSSEEDQVKMLSEFFAASKKEGLQSQRDAIWITHFLSGSKLKRIIASAHLKQWGQESSGLPLWLFEEAHEATGDLAETIALTRDPSFLSAPQATQRQLSFSLEPPTDVDSLTDWIETKILPLQRESLEYQRSQIIEWWRILNRNSIYILNRILLGSFRSPISRETLQLALTPANSLSQDEISKKSPQRTVAAVLLYAQPGRRSSLYTDCTFGVWLNGELVPIAKASATLTHAEAIELNAWIQKNTRSKFGPVRSVDASQVFELTYEGVSASPRRIAGIALKSPRVTKWRKNVPATEAGSLTPLREQADQQKD